MSLANPSPLTRIGYPQAKYDASPPLATGGGFLLVFGSEWLRFDQRRHHVISGRQKR